MSKIYYIGDWAVSCGPVFAETPFNYAFKGLDLYYYGKWLKDAFHASASCSSAAGYRLRARWAKAVGIERG